MKYTKIIKGTLKEVKSFFDETYKDETFVWAFHLFKWQKLN